MAKWPSFQVIGPPFHTPARVTGTGTPYGLTVTLRSTVRAKPLLALAKINQLASVVSGMLA